MRRSTQCGNHDQVPRSEELPYARVLRELRQRLDSGEWDKGEALPTIAALAAEYGVARGTAARALRTLEVEGLVRIVPRWGTFRA